MFVVRFRVRVPKKDDRTDAIRCRPFFRLIVLSTSRDFRLETMNRLLYTTYKVEMKVSLFFA